VRDRVLAIRHRLRRMLRRRPIGAVRLSALDTAALHLENDTQPLHVGSLLILDGPQLDHQALREHIESSFAALPWCRWRVLRMPFDLGRPWWVDSERFDIAEHVHHAVIDPPGDDEQLRRFVEHAMAHRLDVSRPLWGLWQVDGLTGNRWAVVVKAHHAMVDGVLGADLIRMILSADPVTSPPMPSIGQRPSPDRHAPPTRLVVGGAGASWLLMLPLRAMRLLTVAATSPGATRLAVRQVRNGVRQVVRPDLPPNVLNGPLGARRRWGWSTCDLAEVDVVRAATGCTLNDVFLTVLTGAYRGYLLARGESLDGLVLRAIVPVSRRPSDGDRPGNRVSAMFVELPIAVLDPVQRLTVVTHLTRQQKSAGVAASTDAVLRLADHVFAPMLAHAAKSYARAGQRRVNIIASNVPGPRGAQYLRGRRVLDMVPYLPIGQEIRTGAALVTCAGRMTIGITGDAAALPDVDLLIDAVGPCLRELRDACHDLSLGR
jgi:diacylglycerol O-acyltransferase